MGFRTIQLSDLNHGKLKRLKKVFGEPGERFSFDDVISELIKAHGDK